MFEHVYLNDEAKQEEKKARKIILSLYEYFSENENDILKTFDREVIKDYIAGMTDRYAVGVYKDIFLPKFWK
jgi:dGTPase